ncbi:MAG: hypothetical protein R3C19_22785 [Planctomycetaceae bacterium]
MQTGESSLPDSAFLNLSLGPHRRRRQHSCAQRIWLPLLLAAPIIGCGFSRQEVLETRLREHQASIRRLESELAESKKIVAKQDRDLLALRNLPTSDPEQSGVISLASAGRPVTAAWGSATQIRIHGLTAGILRPEDGGPATLNVVVQPLDEDSEVVKAAGELTVTLSTLPGAEPSSPTIAERRLSITECRSTWSRGLIASGFHLQIPIPEAALLPSRGRQVLVTATLDLGGDHVLSDSRLIDSGE